MHLPGSSIVSATLGPRNPDSATKSLPLPHSCMLELLQRQLCLPPADPSSLRQNRSRLMVSHSRVQPLLFMLEAQQKRKRQSWDLICPGKDTTSAQGNLWHCPSVSSQVRGTLGPAATAQRDPQPGGAQAAFPHTRGANPLHDSSVQSAGSLADRCQHTFLFFTLLCHLPWSPQRPSCPSGEEPGLGLRGKETRSVPQDN